MKTIQKLHVLPLYAEDDRCEGYWARGHFSKDEFSGAVNAETGDRHPELTLPSHIKHGWAVVEHLENGEIEWRGCSELEPGAIAVTHNLWWASTQEPETKAETLPDPAWLCWQRTGEIRWLQTGKDVELQYEEAQYQTHVSSAKGKEYIKTGKTRWSHVPVVVGGSNG